MAKKENLQNLQLCVDLANEMEAVIQCPVCMDINNGNVTQCVTGHHICIKCRNQLTDCPTCKKEFTSTKCFLIEDMIQQITKLKVSAKVLDGNVVTENKINDYRKFTKSLIMKLSDFLDSQSKTLALLDRFLKFEQTNDKYNLQHEVTNLTRKIEDMKNFMDDSAKTLSGLKNKSIISV